MSITYCLSIYPLPDFSNVILLQGKFVFAFSDNDRVEVELFSAAVNLNLLNIYQISLTL